MTATYLIGPVPFRRGAGDSVPWYRTRCPRPAARRLAARSDRAVRNPGVQGCADRSRMGRSLRRGKQLFGPNRCVTSSARPGEGEQNAFPPEKTCREMDMRFWLKQAEAEMRQLRER